MLRPKEAIRKYIDFVKEIKKSAGLKTNNIIGELAENYAIEKLGLKKAPINQKHYDAEKNKLKYQIKYRTPNNKGVIKTSFKNLHKQCLRVDKIVILLPTLETFIIDKEYIELKSKKKKNTLIFKSTVTELKQFKTEKP